MQESVRENRIDAQRVCENNKLLLNENKTLRDKVNSLTSDIEQAKKDSGLFIKYVRKCLGGKQ